MKTLKYLIAALAVAFALAGCAGGMGSSNFDGFYPAEEQEELVS